MVEAMRWTWGRLGRLGVLLGPLALAGCGGAPTKGGDGPPGRVVDPATIPDAVPRVEPLSRYGNMASYVVFGRRYHTMRNAEGYRERGIASWYGSKFHGRRTSSGEVYDMYQMTAAHRALPLPTYVEVTNLENGRRAVVKVNDRGPFVGDRIIDLSYAAALRLGLVGPGTGRVEVRAIDPRRPDVHQQLAASTPPTPAVPTSPVARPETGPPAEPVGATVGPIAAVSGPASAGPVASSAADPPPRLFLQAGAFGLRDNADRLRARLEGLRPVGVEVLPTHTDHGTLYRVRLGPLAGAQEVDHLKGRLMALGLDAPRLVVD